MAGVFLGVKSARATGWASIVSLQLQMNQLVPRISEFGHNQMAEPLCLRFHFLVIYKKIFVKVFQLLHRNQYGFWLLSSP